MAAKPAAYQGTDPYVFISYSHKDSDAVYPMISALQKHLNVWYDEGLEVGKHWDSAIAQHLLDSTSVICIVTPNFLTSDNCLDEIHFAKEEKKQVMIVYLGKVDLPAVFRLSYGRIHALTMQPSSGADSIVQEILRTEAVAKCRIAKPAAQSAAPAPSDPAPAKPKSSTPKETPKANTSKSSSQKKSSAPKQSTPKQPAPAKEAAPPKELTAEELYQKGFYLEHGLSDCGQNEKEAADFYLKAAEKGHVKAQYRLGYYHYYKSHNYKEAFRWLKKAAEAKSTDAYRLLGACYLDGTGTQKDVELGLKWLKESAYSGERLASKELGDRFFKGSQVSKDYDEAIYWYKMHVEQAEAQKKSYPVATVGIEMIYKNLGDCYSKGLGNYEEAFRWYQKGFAGGGAYTAEQLGDCYFYGRGTKQNYQEAFRCYKMHAEHYETGAALKLANCYFHGYGVTKNYEQAFRWYKKGARMTEGFVELGDCYYYGYGTAQNYKEAVSCYKHVAQYGNTEAHVRLGNCYLNGHGVTQNHAEAFRYFKKAADDKHPEAHYRMGYCYEHGYGVSQSLNEAIACYQKAVDLGYPCQDELEKARERLNPYKPKPAKRRWFF